VLTQAEYYQNTWKECATLYRDMSHTFDQEKVLLERVTMARRRFSP
jgi:hypothetical protein